MMPKQRIIVFVLVNLVVFLAISVCVKAQDRGPILINANGLVIGTDKIQVEGNIYSLTDNLYIKPIVVECSNIILDGKGFSMQAMSGWSELVAINLTCTNVTVCNFNITNYGVGVLGTWNNNTITNNTFTNVIRAIGIYANNYTVINNIIHRSTFGIRVLNSDNNYFFQNQLINNSFGFDATNSSNNVVVANYFENNNEAFRIYLGGFTVYHNNFINQYREVSKGGYAALILSSGYASLLWDNNYPSGGNYYSDYLSRYPNASEIDNSGIGNIPYQVTVDSNFTDRYPLLTPVNILAPITELPSPNPNLTPSPPSTNSPTPTATTTPTLSPSPTIPEYPTWIILPLLIFTLSISYAKGKKKIQK